MTSIYLDESGDLGFSFERNSSKYFVIALFETSLTEKELKKIDAVQSKYENQWLRFFEKIKANEISV